MAITKQKGSNKKTGKCRLAIDGDMTIYRASANHKTLVGYLADFTDIEMSLCDVEEIDCSGIQILVALNDSAQKQEKRVTISSVSPAVEEVMDTLNIRHQFSWSDNSGASHE